MTSEPPSNQLLPSLTALKDAHSALLQSRRSDGETEALLDAAERFIQAGQQTGVLLDSDDERDVAQSLMNYWANVLLRAGRDLSDATLDEFDPMQAPELPDELQPFVGLEPFDQQQHDLFFGRERLIEQMVERLKTTFFLFVVGSSGSGKSSLVLGGVLPKLKVNALPDSAQWRYLPPIVPGADVLANLARITCPPDMLLVEWTVTFQQQALADPTYLRCLFDAASDQPTVLVVDQFEEIFTLGDDPVARQALIDNLLECSISEVGRHFVILTVRSDFEDRVALIPPLQAAFERGQVRVTALSAAELREAIERPAQRVGLRFEDGIVEELIREILGEPAGLPLLQFTLLKLWENRERNRVTWDVYRRVGGGRLALARSADEFFDRLIPEEQVTARRILLRMVRPSEGLEFTSNRVRRDALYQGGEARDRVDRVIAKLVQARLVRVTSGDTPIEDQFSVAHEALVRNWPRLVEWLEEERAAIAMRRRLESKAAEWARLGRNTAGLLDEVQLVEAERWLNSSEAAYLGYDPRLRDLVIASRSLLEKERREQEAVRQRELDQARQIAAEQQARAEAERQQAEAERKRAASERQASRRLRVLAGLVTLVAVLAVGLAVWAVDLQRNEFAARQESQRQAAEARAALATAESAAQAADVARQTADVARTVAETERLKAEEERQNAEAERQNAERQALLARAGELAAQSLAARERPQLALLLASEAVSSTLRVAIEPPPVATAALSEALQLTRGSGVAQALNTAVSADGRVVVTQPDADSLAIWDVQGTNLVQRPQRLTVVGAVALWLSADGRWLLVADEQRLVLYDLQSADVVASGRELNTARPLEAVAFSANGQLLAVSGANSRDITLLATADGTAAARTLTGHTGAVRALAFSNDLRWLLSGSNDGTAKLWNLGSANPSATTLNPRGAITAVAFSPNLVWLATGSEDNDVHLWRFSGNGILGNTPIVLEAHQETVTFVRFSPDSRWLTTAGLDRTPRLWDLSRPTAERPRAGTLAGHTNTISTLAYSPDGRWLATASADQSILLWDLNAPNPADIRIPLFGHDQAVTVVGFLADNNAMLSLGDDQELRLWSVPPATREERIAQIQTLTLEQQVELACRTAGRSLLPNELQRAGLPPTYPLSCR
jgi:WD40 repeat protein